MLAGLAYTLVIGGGLLLYRLLIVYPELETRTLTSHQDNITSIYATYINEIDGLISFNLDWAKWDETHQFSLDHNNVYITRNIQSNSFLEADVDAVIILDSKNKPLYLAEKINNKFVTKLSILDITSDLNIKTNESFDNQYGLIRNKNGIAYFASNLIQNSEETSKVSGTLIFIRYIKEDFLQRLKYIANIDLKFIIFNEQNNKNLVSLRNYKIKKIQNIYTFGMHSINGDTIGSVDIIYPKNTIPKPIDTITIISISIVLLLPIFITLMAYCFFLVPITKIFKQINNMKRSGEVDHLIQESHITEISAFINSFNKLVDKTKQYQKELIADSNTDGLTGIHNRKHFDDEFDKTWRISSRNESPISIIMIDIDYFKKYNDEYGHQQGDEALKQVAKALHRSTRRAEDTLARYGGEEFVILLHAKNTQQLENSLSELLKSIEHLKIEHIKSSASANLSISIGACFIDNPGSWMINQKKFALKKADDALYEAKNNGRNQYSIRTFNASGKTE